MRPLLLALAALLGTACFQPGGRCSTDRDCPSDTHCSGGLCLVEGASAAGERCEDPRDCASACCTCTDGLCVLLADGCQLHSDCDSWERCQDYSCRPTTGRCNARSDCEEWQVCSAEHFCVPDVGRCEDGGHCATWEYCERNSHRCQPVGPECPRGTECEAWQACTKGHCVNQPGRCALTDQCDPSWQLCSSNLCRPAPGRCADDSGCDTAFQACTSHTCKTRPGMCGSPAECQFWEQCSEHTCILRDGYCASHADCLPTEACNSAHQCIQNRSEVGKHNCAHSRVIGPPSEEKRFQVFVAGDRPRLVEVLLTVQQGSSTRAPLAVSLYSVPDATEMPGAVLATKTVASSDLGATFKKVSVPLTYNSLKAGQRYAIVLGQSDRPDTCDDGRCYYWCTGDNHLWPAGHLANGAWRMDPDTGAVSLAFEFR